MDGSSAQNKFRLLIDFLNLYALQSSKNIPTKNSHFST
uniref:Uncharacterized protein n=1 Tax=Anguilla anguilla TaxID=7936 RepID=A0A0E9V938_ANGAN